MLFGDLVFCSDSGEEILERYISMAQKQKEQLKLFGIRKVFSEHTYQTRLEYIVNKVSFDGAHYRTDIGKKGLDKFLI